MNGDLVGSGRRRASQLIAAAMVVVAVVNGSMTTVAQVGSEPVTVTLTVSPQPVVFGQAVTLTATVSGTAGGPTPTGTVTLVIDGEALSPPVSLNTAGQATALVALSAGDHTIRVDYSGDATYAASSSNTVQPRVDKAPVTISLVSSEVNPPRVGQRLTFTATVSSGSRTVPGSINFDVVGGGAANVPIVGNTATLTLSFSVAGFYTVVASYPGSANFNAATASVIETIIPANTTTIVTSSPNPSVFGQPVTLTATVSVVAPGAGTPTGTVSFVDQNGTALGTATLENANASLVLDDLAVGSHSITANFGGDANFGFSNSTHIHTVASGTTQTALAASTNPSSIGEPVTFTATVTATGTSVTDGTVTFSDGATPLGSVPVDSTGQATLAADTLPVGAHTITADYSGTDTLEPSSAQLDHQVDPAPDTTTTSTTTTTPATTSTTTTPATTTSSSSTTTTTSQPDQSETVTELMSSTNPSVFGQPVTFTATVTVGAGSTSAPLGFRSAPQQFADGGTLTISDGDTVLATVAVEAGEASFTTSSLSVGTHTITAAFSGTGTAAPSSVTIVQQVDEPAPVTTTTQPAALPATR